LQRFSALIVEDFENLRRFFCLVLQEKVGCQVIAEASDGLEAVRKAEELQPDLILLDLGLPSLNGLEVARQARKLAPAARILFLSQESSPDIVQEALRLGAHGYVHKAHSQTELLPAIEAVLGGRQFVGSGLESATNAQPPYRHEMLFCSSHATIVDGLARFIAAALNAGNPAIVWATESSRAGLFKRLRAQGVDVDAALQRGTCIFADIAEPPDLTRMVDAVRALSVAASKAGTTRPRVAVCGERAGRLWAEGRTDEAIGLEQLLNELSKHHDIDVLCPYPLPQTHHDTPLLNSIRAEHSAVSYG